MKSLHTPVLVLAAFLLVSVLGPPRTQAQDQDKVEDPDAIVYVDGLACPFCAYGLEKKLDDYDAVQELQVEIEEGRILLVFREGQALTKDEIDQAVEEAGFTARKIELRNEEPPETLSL